MAARLSAAQALKTIKSALGGTGIIEVHPHARKGLRDDDFDMNDLTHAIQRGRITGEEPDMRGETRYRLEGPSVNEPRRPVGLVFVVRNPDPPDVLVISAFDESTRYGRK